MEIQDERRREPDCREALLRFVAVCEESAKLVGNRFHLIRTKLHYENNDMQRPRWNLRSETDGWFLG